MHTWPYDDVATTTSCELNQSANIVHLSPMPGPSNARERAASNELHTPGPPAKTSREESNGDNDTISIHADEDVEQDKAIDKFFR